MGVFKMTYYKVAAKWWADTLRNVGPGNFNNGDDSQAGGMAMIMATMLAMDKSPDGGVLDRFEKVLAENIQKRVEEDGCLSLNCDYAPCAFLANIARETGVDVSCFPWKTSMQISPLKVTVSCGYGAAWDKIYPKSK